MVEDLLKTQADTIIVLFAAAVDANPCIFGEKKMKGLWKGKNINYVPGRLMVGLRSGASLEQATQLIAKNNGTVDYISKSSIDIIVDNQKTLEIASKLEELDVFKFVTPEIMVKNC
jgi:hypothetical protein